MLDIEGQSRPADVAQKDVGCDEVSTAAQTNQPLKLSDVGPLYLSGVRVAPSTQSLSATMSSAMVNAHRESFTLNGRCISEASQQSRKTPRLS